MVKLDKVFILETQFVTYQKIFYEKMDKNDENK